MKTGVCSLWAKVWSAVLVSLMCCLPGTTMAEQPGTPSQELAELKAVTEAATAYAMSRDGIAIIVHVGDDIPNAHFASGEAFGAAIAAKFKADFQIEARAFPRQNAGTPATLISYHIGHLIHGAHDGSEIKDVQAALGAMPNAAEQFRLIQELGPALSGHQAD